MLVRPDVVGGETGTCFCGEYVVAMFATDRKSAGRLCRMLRDHGIAAQSDSESELCVAVLVPDEDLVAATEILAKRAREVESEDELDDEDTEEGEDEDEEDEEDEDDDDEEFEEEYEDEFDDDDLDDDDDDVFIDEEDDE